MNILLICLFIVVLFTLLSKMPLVVWISKHHKYDNNHPRLQVNQLTGFGARAWSGHMNSYEFLSVFASAILAAVATNNQTYSNEILAITATTSRVVYHTLYLLNYPTLRTLIWSVGLICSLAILYSCI